MKLKKVTVIATNFIPNCIIFPIFVRLAKIYHLYNNTDTTWRNYCYSAMKP